MIKDLCGLMNPKTTPNTIFFQIWLADFDSQNKYVNDGFSSIRRMGDGKARSQFL